MLFRSIVIIAIIVTTVLVTSVILLPIITGFMMTVCKYRSSKQEVSAEEDVPYDSPSNIPVPLYESVFPMEFQEQGLELKENTAYGSLPTNEPVYSSIT